MKMKMNNIHIALKYRFILHFLFYIIRMYFYFKFVHFIIDDFRVYLAWDGKANGQKAKTKPIPFTILYSEMDANEKPYII